VLLLALDARLRLRGAGGQRVVPLREFFLAYKRCDLRQGEIIESIEVPLRSTMSRLGFEKVCRRRILDIASVNSAIVVTGDENDLGEVGISAGGVAPIPLFLQGASRRASGSAVTPELVQEIAEIARGEISPISDVRGSARYKTILLRQLIHAHFMELFPERCPADRMLPIVVGGGTS
jgi:xanthine dehydrogenase small subunit